MSVHLAGSLLRLPVGDMVLEVLLKLPVSLS